MTITNPIDIRTYAAALIEAATWWATDESTCTPDSVPGTPVGAPAAAIHLGLPLPAGSSGLPADIGRAALKRLRGSSSCGDGPFLALLRVGFTEPPRSPGVLVGSYPTVSPLPSRYGPAVCFLWHCPAGHPGLPLATTLPCGVRTFLGDGPEPDAATARSTRPSRPHPNDAPTAPISTPAHLDRPPLREGGCINRPSIQPLPRAGAETRGDPRKPPAHAAREPEGLASGDHGSLRRRAPARRRSRRGHSQRGGRRWLTDHVPGDDRHRSAAGGGERVKIGVCL